MLYSVQYLRAIAALLVIVVHLAGFHFEGFNLDGNFGAVGVDLFFMISGFIMWETSRTITAGRFLIKRLIRIVPTYWFYTILLVALATVVPRITPNVRLEFPYILKSLFFMPFEDDRGNINPLLLQGWTLNYEIFFYAVFAVSLIFNNPTFRLLSLIIIFTIFYLAGLVVDKNSSIILFFYSRPVIFEFIAGVLVSHFIQSQIYNKFVYVACFLCGVLYYTFSWFYHLQYWTGHLLAVGLPSFLVVFGAIGLEDIIRKMHAPALLKIGESSYSLYLCHPFVLSGSYIVSKYVGDKFDFNAVWSLALFIACSYLIAPAVAMISYRYIEAPSVRYLTMISRRKPSWSSARQID